MRADPGRLLRLSVGRRAGLATRALMGTLLSAVSCFAAEGEAVRAFEAAGARVEVRRDGTFRLTRGETAVIANGALVLFGPQWESANQGTAEARARAEDDAVRIEGRLTEKASGKPVSFTQRVSPRDGGIRFDYEVKLLDPVLLNEVSLILDLPIALFKGKGLLLYPRVATQFPAEQPVDRHFVSSSATRCLFGSGDPYRIGIHLDRPRVCNVQDTREWKGSHYQAFIKLHAGNREFAAGEVLKLSFTLFPEDRDTKEAAPMALHSEKPLRIGNVRTKPEAAKAGDLVTLHVELEGTWRTPFRQEEVALDALFRGPDGRTWKVPGFYTLDYEREQVGPAGGDALESLTPGDAPEWQVRFLPSRPGRYEVTLQAADRSGRVEERRAFDVAPGKARPLVRVSRTDPRYFELEDGTPYFANGLNVCWYGRSGGTYDYDRWFGRLAEAGGNYARLWMPEWAFGYEWGKPGEYRLDRAWQMDYVLRLAEEKGIYLKLCLENFRSFTAANPYARGNGGPCDRVMDFFTNDEAKRMWRNRLRYAVARWGYSPNLLAWEFWNEINCVAEKEKDPAYRYNAAVVQAWAKEMAVCLRSIDPFGHLVVNSLGSFVFEPELWSLKEMDFAQVHGYWHPTLVHSHELGKDMARMVGENVARIRGFGKPALFAEFGLVNQSWGLSPRVKDDPEGVHLHNGLWGAMMAGAAGTAHLWWWDNYVDPQNLWYQFRGVAGFVRDVPFTTAGFEPFEAQPEPASLRVLGLRGKGLTLLWAQNRAHTWWNVAEKLPVPPVQGARIRLPELAGKRCTVEVWDTYTGKRLSTREATAGPDGLEIDAGTVAKDLALKVYPGRGDPVR